MKRMMMISVVLLVAGAFALPMLQNVASAGCGSCGSGADHHAAETKLGWRLGVQAYTYRALTFFEAVDKASGLGMHYIEAYSRQKVSKDHGGAMTTPDMSDDVVKAVQAKLKAADMKLVCYGVVRLKNDEADCRKYFDFAKKMGIETLVAEPSEDAFDLIDKLCEEYKINVSIHNHPKPSHYFSPEAVLKVCKGRSKRIGACADTGHWVRSGLDPVACLKKLEGRIISVHIKDIEHKPTVASAAMTMADTTAPKKDAAKGKKAKKPKREKIHDVPFGTGVCDMDAILKELKRQGFKGVFSIEYEDQRNLDADMAKCVKYWNAKTAELAK
jgi:sugar phosphate isomerase/epimerase